MRTPHLPSFGIFVVDDIPEVASELEFMLADLGMPVRSWNSCEDCLQALDWDSSGVIFIDYLIEADRPVMQGPDLLDRLVAWRSPLVVVIMSNRSASEEILVEEAFRLGMNNRGHCIAYIYKKLDDEVVSAAAKKALAYADRWSNRKQRERLMIQALLERITPAELFVMEGVLKGLTSKDIAAAHWEYLQRNPPAPKDAKKRKKPKQLPGADLEGAWRGSRDVPTPPPEQAAHDLEDSKEGDDAVVDVLDHVASAAAYSRDVYIPKRGHVVDTQRNGINNWESRLGPLGVRIDDFDVLLDERFGSLRELLEGEVEMRLNLLTPTQRATLDAARPHGNKAAPSAALSEALHRIRAADVNAFNNWYPKIEHLRDREWVWSADTAIAAPGNDPD